MKTWGTKPIFTSGRKLGDDEELEHAKMYLVKTREFAVWNIFTSIQEAENIFIEQITAKLKEQEEVTPIYVRITLTPVVTTGIPSGWVEIEAIVKSNHPFAVPLLVYIFVAAIGLALGIGIAFAVYEITTEVMTAFGGIPGLIIILFAILMIAIVLGGARLDISKKGVTLGKRKR